MKRTPLVLALAVFATAACAPRVSNKRPQSPAASAPVQAPAKLAQKQPQKALSPTPPKDDQPKIVQASYVVAKPAPAPAPAPAPVEEAPPPPPAPKKKTYYSYSDSEIAQLRKQSRDFKKLDDELKSCTKRTEAAIERREQIPTDIAKIRMSAGGLNPAKEKQIAKLKAEQDRLKSVGDRSACTETENKLTAMLEEKLGGGTAPQAQKKGDDAESEIY
ncbi:MAG: hypothetical protein U1E65_33035 [Myxococcota bacterium]